MPILVKALLTGLGLTLGSKLATHLIERFAATGRPRANEGDDDDLPSSGAGLLDL